MTDADLSALIQIFSSDRPPRVWSLVVSLFGDFAQGTEAAINSQHVNHVLTDIGIRPEAIRVALHRLRKEGWLHSDRQGRSSLYSLTEMGRKETLAAIPRIYDVPDSPEESWIVIHRPKTSFAEIADGYSISPTVTLCTTKPDNPEAFTKQILHSDALPAWMFERLCKSEFVAQTSSTADRLKELQSTLSEIGPLNPHASIVLRVLVVHNWRRIALRAPALPAYLFPDAWRGEECRALALGLLKKLPRPELKQLGSPG
ncbi:PaaX family transcriptional regulator C-terminal domain-containing protein [uncultured Ruegeria sp.]|uniref:PaaX family transcriptional regulator C-terminal domain-containing protein n=1 Tax=uncultured Ruegeria sp. TaxID=259304 RepID=UPI0026279EB3|nr:PaaX family transcriptional regulator C-terminal domain-containing protein [uncultured Ruegeria sp.]